MKQEFSPQNTKNPSEDQWSKVAQLGENTSPAPIEQAEKLSTPRLRKIGQKVLGILGIRTKSNNGFRPSAESEPDTEAVLEPNLHEETDFPQMPEAGEIGDIFEQAKQSQAQSEAEAAARSEQRERESLEHDMAEARTAFNERFARQRTQELVERDLNSRLLSIDSLEEEVLSENPEVAKRSVFFEDTEIPVYDLKGIPFSMLSTTIDYRKSNEGKKGRAYEIGQKTYRMVMDDPSVWAQHRDEAETSSGFGTREEDARGDTISTSYYNSERNLKSRVKGDLIYGFDHVSADSIISINNRDNATSNMAGKSKTTLDDPNILNKLESGGNGGNTYNEVLLRRYSESGAPKLPDYIITENGNLSEAALRHAKYYQIPIVNIETGIYDEKMLQHGAAIIDSISENDSYPELDQKIVDLTSLASYKNNYRDLENVGLRDPNSFQDMGLRASGVGQQKYLKCFEVSELEQQKRLEFIRDTLEAATASIEDATKNGQSAPTKPAGFDIFNIELDDFRNGRRYYKYGIDSAPHDRSGNCNCIKVSFRLKDSTRDVKTTIYDGARVTNPENLAIYSQEDIDAANSRDYDALAPLVLKYFDAYQKNQQK